MSNSKRESTAYLTPVICVNPDSGQRIRTTIKVYESIYADKGFVLVSSDNADAGVNRSAPTKKQTAKVSAGAASIASTLGIGQTAPAEGGEVMTFTEAAAKAKAARVQGEPRRDLGTSETTDGSDVADEGTGNDDADDANADGSVITPEREPTKRDRGRG